MLSDLCVAGRYVAQTFEPAMAVVATATDFVGTVLQIGATKPPSDEFYLLKVR